MRCLILLALLALTGCKNPLENKFVKNDEPAQFSPIVRLSAIYDGHEHFFCTGTVVSTKYIITAAHCVQGAPPDMVIMVRSVDETFGGVAKVSAAGYQLDFAILEGSFAQFDKMPFETNTARIVHSFKHSRSMEACGYPGGGDLTCQRFANAKPFTFFFSAPGVAMYPGMSGGPVIDLETGKLIGVNTAMTENEALLTPIVEIFKTLHVTQD